MFFVGVLFGEAVAPFWEGLNVVFVTEDVRTIVEKQSGRAVHFFLAFFEEI